MGSERGQDNTQKRMWRLSKEAEVQREAGELKKGVDSPRGMQLRRQEPWQTHGTRTCMAKGWVRALGTHRGPRHAGSSWRQQPSLPPPPPPVVPRVTALYSCPPALPPEQDGLPGLGISQLLVVKQKPREHW